MYKLVCSGILKINLDDVFSHNIVHTRFFTQTDFCESYLLNSIMLVFSCCRLVVGS